MNFSTIVLHCGHCSERIGNMFVDDICSLTAEEVILFLEKNRLSLLCSECSCEHEYNTVRLLDTGQRNEAIAERDYS